MPVYTYHCDQCDHEFEKYQSFSEEALTTCPKCGQKTLRKVYQPALVLFKGSGFYVTDTKSHSPTLSSSNGDKRSSSEPSAEKSTEKKTETKAEKKTTKQK
ncbi:MAG: zinc ribbon domain-containing protein [Anaerolineales bacterium]|nr:zinc ribbon domain-containing protein [Anaerolineales bacterium]